MEVKVAGIGEAGHLTPTVKEKNKTPLLTFWLITPTLSGFRERVRASHTNNCNTDTPSDETMLDIHHLDALPSDSRWQKVDN